MGSGRTAGSRAGEGKLSPRFRLARNSDSQSTSPPHPNPLPGGERGKEVRGHFPDHIAEFARVLRRAGMPVGPGAVVDAVKAAEASGIERRMDFYWALH